MNQYKLMLFPEVEWDDIQKYLNKNGECSTIRCCKEINKYRVGDIYKSPWGELLEIKSVEQYSKLEDVPTYKYLNEEMKKSALQAIEYGNGKWDYVIFKRCENKY